MLKLHYKIQKENYILLGCYLSSYLTVEDATQNVYYTEYKGKKQQTLKILIFINKKLSSSRLSP